jgi:hypothetical protein
VGKVSSDESLTSTHCFALGSPLGQQPWDCTQMCNKVYIFMSQAWGLRLQGYHVAPVLLSAQEGTNRHQISTQVILQAGQPLQHLPKLIPKMCIIIINNIVTNLSQTPSIHRGSRGARCQSGGLGQILAKVASLAPPLQHHCQLRSRWSNFGHPCYLTCSFHLSCQNPKP